MKNIIPLIITVFIISCAGSAFRFASMNPEEMKNVQLEEDKLIKIVRFHPNNPFSSKINQKILNEITRRGIVTESEAELIRNERIRIGMSEKALVMSWGEGEVYKRISQYNVYRTHVYISGLDYSKKYTFVRVLNGKVIGWGTKE